jgi:hypothetical protein
MSKTRRNHKKKNQKINKKMRGGDLSHEDEDQLRELNFDDDEIAHFNELNIPFNIINQAIQYYHNNSHRIISDIAEQMVANQNEAQNNNSGFDSLHESDLADNGNANEELADIDNIPAIPHADDDNHHLDDLNDLDNSGETTFDFDNSLGGKRRSKKRYLPIKNKKRTRNMRGGRCYGNGVGANSYDPNYSIYNTNLMKLFPYKA